jgi:hypothetical protein
MSEPAGKGPGVKTLGIRLPDDLHAQFALVAQLDGISLTDAIRRAIETYVATKQAEPNFQARVTAALEEIEREATGRKSAIQALLGQTAPAAGGSTATKATGRSPRGKAPGSSR